MVVAMVANAAIPPTIQLGDEFTSVAALDGKTFAIVDKAAEKALYGSNNQNLAFDAYSSAFVTTNSGYTWQLESLAENEDESVHGYYLLHLVAPNGTPVPTSDWEGKYLNSQDKGGWCCFNLGIKAKKLGQDIDYGAVWDVQFVEGKGFSLKNIGTGLYKGADGGTANKEEAVYFAFVSVSTTYVPALKALLAEGEAMKKRGASSADYDAAIEGIDPDKSADALADAQKVEAALPALAKTQLTAGSDFTRAIANFDCAAKDGWTFDKPKGGNGPDHGGDFEYWAGNASNRAEASFDYWQEITGLPNGTYTVSAEMYNSLNNEGGNYTEFKPTVGVYATVGEKTVSKLVDVNSETRVPYVTDAIEVTDGKIRIGAKSFEAPMAARWFTVDNFKLTLVKPAVAPTAPEKDAWYTGADFFRFRADKNATAESPYYAWKDKVEPVWGADADDVSNGCIVCNVPANVNPQSQIWIRGTEAGKTVANGSKDGFRVTFRVKADGEYTLESQAHNGWGYKTGGNPFGPLNVTTEWQTVSFVCTGEKAKNDFTDLCFNLSGDAERTIYFDDVQIVRGSEWYLNNEFHAKDYQDPTAKYSDGQDPHPAARFVSDAEGGYVEVISNANAGQTYNSQLWIAIPEKYVGTSTKMTMEVQASKAIKCPESFQATATGNGWGCNPGPGNGVDFTVGKWTTVERVLKTNGVKSTGTWKNLQADQYCLDLSEASGDKEAIIYKFRNVKFEDAEEAWTETMAYRVKVTPFVEGVKQPDTNDAPTYSFGTGGEEGGYFEVTAAGKQEQTYETQFFFQIADVAPSKALKKNETVKLSFKIKALATETLAAGTEIQAGGGFHGSYDGANWMAGAPAAKFKVGEWTPVELTLDISEYDKGVPTCYSIDLSQDANPITYLIDEVSATWAEAPVLDWVDLIPLQDFEAGYTGADDEIFYFLSKENVIAADDTHRSRIVEGAGKDSKYGIEFRTQGGSANWDSQFEIRFPYQLPNGTKYRIEFDYMVNATANFGTQSWDGGVGSYASGGTKAMTVKEGEVNTWLHYSDEYKISRDNGLRWDVFDMAQSGQPNAIVFIDNIRVQVPSGTLPIKDTEGKEVAPDYLSATEYPIYTYIDPTTLDWTDNIFTNGDVEGEDMSSFISKVNDDEDALLLPAATKVFKESNQVMVKTVAREKDPADETKYLGNDHDTQFFVRLPYALKKGTKFFFSVDYISNKVADVQSQTHAEPGEWKSNTGVGKITTGSTSQTLADYFTADNDMRTIAFNLASATEGGTFYFDNFVFKVVKDEEADIKAFTQTWDETSKWNESLALNVAYDKGRNAETEGCTEESVKALDDAMAAGKAILQPAEGAEPATKDAIAAAAKAIEDAIAGLEKGGVIADCDLTADMFFTWDAVDATASKTGQAGCAYDVNKSTGMPYGDGSVNEYNFADLTAYDHLAITATEGEPRLLFNRAAQDDHQGPLSVELPRDFGQNKFEAIVDNGEGSKTYVINLKAITEKDGYAHLHAIKGANWANTTVTAMKLFVGASEYSDVLTNINGVEDGASVKDGKYFINGQIVIVKNGVKYNAAGVAIK